MAAISPGPPSAPYHHWWWRFPSASHLSMFHWTKLKFQHRLLGDSSPSLTSIHSPWLLLFSHCDLVLFSLGVTDALLWLLWMEIPFPSAAFLGCFHTNSSETPARTKQQNSGPPENVGLGLLAKELTVGKHTAYPANQREEGTECILDGKKQSRNCRSRGRQRKRWKTMRSRGAYWYTVRGLDITLACGYGCCLLTTSRLKGMDFRFRSVFHSLQVQQQNNLLFKVTFSWVPPLLLGVEF